jgi:hypothetical protein
VLRRILCRSLLVGAGILAAPDDGLCVDAPNAEEIDRPSEPATGHVKMTRAIDIVCPACNAPLGDRCGPALCKARVLSAAKRTRQANRLVRTRA